MSPKSGAGGPDSGQALVFMAIAGPVLAVLLLFLANLGILGSNRAKTWGGTDMTALSGATLYARGLNVLSASNALAVGAAIADAIILAGTRKDPKSRKAVQAAQNAFVKVWEAVMEAGTLFMAGENGLRVTALPPPSPVVIWNPEAGGSLLPSLNVRRRSLWELLGGAFGGGEGGKEDGEKPGYTDSAGERHEFEPDQVERAGSYPSGRPRYRVKPGVPDSGGRRHAGKFVTKGDGGSPAGGLAGLGAKILKAIEADLVDEAQGVHTVLVYANRDVRLSLSGTGVRHQHALAEGEAYGGSLEFWKEGPQFDGRLIRISPEALSAIGPGFLGSALSLAIRH